MNTFRFEIKRKHRPYYVLLSVALILLNLAALTAMGYQLENAPLRWLIWAFSVLIIGIIIYQYRNRPKNTPFRLGTAIFFLAGIPWFSLNNYWVMAVILFFGFLENWLYMREYVQVNETGIVLPGLRPRRLPWQDVRFMVLRDGVLTLEKTNNHFLQWDVSDPGIDQQQFNLFCESQLARS